MSQVFVVPTNQQVLTTSKEFAILGFRSIIPGATVTGANEDPDHPFTFCVDYQDDTQYSPNIDSGTVNIEIRRESVETVNYVGIALHNAFQAGLTGSLDYWDGLQWVPITAFGSLKDNFPLTLPFDDIQAQRFRLNLTFTSKLFIGSIYLGEAIKFPATPSVGFQPPKYNRLDEVKSFQTAGNNFTRSRKIIRNNQAKGAFNFYLFSELEQWWLEYLDHIYDSRPVYFRWSNVVNDPIYGRQNINQPPRISYVNSFNARLDFEFNGYADR